MRIKKSAGAVPMSPDSSPTYQSYIDQAEVCREQASEAARLQRFSAAWGLFDTAIALCINAISVGGEKANDASDILRGIRNEQAAYSELAKSLKRPLLVMPAVVTASKPPLAGT